MRTPTAGQSRLYSLARFASWVRVDVEDGDAAFQNLRSFLSKDWILGVEWGEDVDSDMATATVQLRRDHDKLSIARLMQASRANLNAAGSYDPLLALHREIRIYGAVTPENYDPVSGDWVLLFGGRITNIDDSGPEVMVTAVDRYGDLVSRFIEDASTYSTPAGSPVQTVMGTILSDHGSLHTLYTPTSPGWNITQFQSECQSVADQLQVLVQQIGWSLRWKWDSDTSAFRLTFFPFDRATVTSLYTFAANTWLDLTVAAIDEADIRNVIDVVYSDPATLDATGAPTRTTYTASDATSIAAYGRRWMSIAEDATSNIDTATEAQTLADNVLSDLKDPVASYTIDALFHFFVELGDIYTIAADNIRFSANQLVSVVGYRHRFDEAGARTSIQCRAAAASGGRARWFRIAGIPGVAATWDMTGPPAPTVAATDGPADVRITATKSRVRGLEYETHVGAVGFTPDTGSGSTTIIGRGKGESTVIVPDSTRVPIGELFDVVTYAVDGRGNRSTATRSASRRANRVGPQYLAPEARVAPGFPGGVFYSQTRGSLYPPDGWTMAVGTWGTDAGLDAGLTYTAPRTGKYALTMKDTAVATSIYGDYIPITPGRTYAAQVEIKASVNNQTITVAVEWLDTSFAVSSTMNLYNSAATAADTWQLVSALVSPPSGTAYARVKVTKAAAAFYLSLDRVLFDEAPEVDNAIHGYRIMEDFGGSGAAGELDWSLTQLGADPATNPTIPSKAAATASTERGIATLTTPGVGSYGAIVHLGAADGFYGLPSVGSVFKVKVKVDTGTNVVFWAGIFDSTSTFPDASGVNSLKGIGVRGSAAGAGVNYKAISRDGTNDSEEDLGVSMGSTYRTIGFRRTLTGIQPMLGDHDVGSEITTDIPTLAACSLMWGAWETSAAARTVSVDFIAYQANERRYDP